MWVEIWQTVFSPVYCVKTMFLIFFVCVFMHYCSIKVCRPASFWALSSASVLSEWRLHHLGHQLVQFYQSLEPQGGLHHWTAQSQNVSGGNSLSDFSFISFNVSIMKIMRLCWYHRRSPLNEDVFAARTKDYVPVTYEEIKDLQAKIYKLFLQVNLLFHLLKIIY